MLHEALTAAEMLADQSFSLRVVNLPWLNRLNEKWLEETIADCQTIFALDNHSEYGGLGDLLLNGLMLSHAWRHKKLIKFAIAEHAACGTPQEALRHHALDGESLVERILKYSI
jgi:transketolase C-terminal domain/subunit